MTTVDELCHCERETTSEWGPHMRSYHDSAGIPLAMVIDGNNMLMRCIKATEYAGMASDQISTSALTAFIGALSRCIRGHGPDSLVVCWDHGPSKHRLSIYPEYKQARAERPEDEHKETSFGLAKRFLEVTRIQQVAVEGFEADDLVAAYWAQTMNMRTMIVSGDKDFFQLLDLASNTVQLRPDGVGGYQIWSADEVMTKYGCAPDRMPLLMALMGDPIDGIPGVRGIGPKKALSGLLEADWDFSKMKSLQGDEKLPMAITSLRLVDLRSPVWHPEVPEIKSFKPICPDDGKDFLPLMTFCKSLELESVLQKIYTNTLWN